MCSGRAGCTVSLYLHGQSGGRSLSILREENIFALATDFFFKAGPRGWVGWEDSSSSPQFLEYVFFLCKYGVNEEKMRETSECRTLLGRGVDVREGRTKRGTRGAN